MQLKDALNSPTYAFADHLALAHLGSALRSLPVQLYKQAPVSTDASELATETAIVLPDDAKASVILRAYARAGTTGALGEMTIAAANATPSTGQIAVAPNGDIVVLAADGYTSIDVVYLPLKGKPLTLTAAAVASNSLAIPAGYTVLGLNAATSVAGTLTGALKVLAPGASVATGKAALNAAKTAVVFASADAVTSATVTLVVTPTVDLHAALELDVEF